MKLLRVFLILTGVSLVANANVDVAPSKLDTPPSNANLPTPQVAEESTVSLAPKKTAASQSRTTGSKTCIIVVVNKDVITAADLDQRLRLVNLGSGRPVTDKIPDDVRKQVIQGMIDEHLQLQAAKSKKIKVDDADVEKALENLAKDNKMTLEAMVKMLKSNGISKQTMLTRLRAQMAWGRYIREAYGPLVHIADKEVDKFLSQAKDIKIEEPPVDMMDVTLCQVVFDVKPDTPEDVMMILGPKIEEAHQAKGCAAFLKAAQGYGAKIITNNQSIKLGQLPAPLKPLVHKTKAGTCMQPTMTPEGLVVTMVCSKSMPKAEARPPQTRDTAAAALEQEKLGKYAAQVMAKLKSAAFVEWM